MTVNGVFYNDRCLYFCTCIFSVTVVVVFTCSQNWLFFTLAVAGVFLHQHILCFTSACFTSVCFTLGCFTWACFISTFFTSTCFTLTCFILACITSVCLPLSSFTLSCFTSTSFTSTFSHGCVPHQHLLHWRILYRQVSHCLDLFHIGMFHIGSGRCFFASEVVSFIIFGLGCIQSTFWLGKDSFASMLFWEMCWCETDGKRLIRVHRWPISVNMSMWNISTWNRLIWNMLM